MIFLFLLKLVTLSLTNRILQNISLFFIENKINLFDNIFPLVIHQISTPYLSEDLFEIFKHSPCINKMSEKDYGI